MRRKEKLQEEVEFWLIYISEWEINHNEPVPDRAQLLLDNALLKLENYFFDKKYDRTFQGINPTVH